MDTLNLVLPVISVVIAITICIVGTWFGYKFVKNSGGFRKVALDVTMLNQALFDPEASHNTLTGLSVWNPKRISRRSPVEEIIFGYSTNSLDKAICYFPLSIRNNGQLSARNVTVTLKVPLGLRLDDMFLTFELVPAVFDQSAFTRVSVDDQGFQYTTYTIPQLNPRTTLTINEPIIVSNTSMTTDVDAITKDKVPITVKVEVTWKGIIDIQISATDVAPLFRRVFVGAYQAKDVHTLVDQLMEAETKAYRNELRSLEVPEDFAEKAYAPGIRKMTVLIISHLEEVPKPNEFQTIEWSVYQENLDKSERYLIAPKSKSIRRL